jgi:hypothetical protein
MVSPFKKSFYKAKVIDKYNDNPMYINESKLKEILSRR